MAEKERQMNKKVNALSAKLRAEEEEVCWENMRLSVTVRSWCSAQTCSSDIR